MQFSTGCAGVCVQNPALSVAVQPGVESIWQVLYGDDVGDGRGRFGNGGAIHIGPCSSSVDQRLGQQRCC
jgi:hypothetical protein